MAPFVLFCAGEDSGDALGEAFVVEVSNLGFLSCGTGGVRMQARGLQPVDDFENLPVSGFGDVLPHYFRLRNILKCLSEKLKMPECKALVAIDYPGFNMPLVSLAKRLNKPVLYVAPPQIWAWKAKRARKLCGINLAVLFDFEKISYSRFGCCAKILKHPFIDAMETAATEKEFLNPPLNMGNDCTKQQPPEILFLPGSRKSQSLRNLNGYLAVAEKLYEIKGCHIKIMAARSSLKQHFENRMEQFFDERIPSWITVEVTPSNAKDRYALYRGAACAVVAPGTATVELALSACPMVIATIPDGLTYIMGYLLVKTRFFAIPNILLSDKESAKPLLEQNRNKENCVSAPAYAEIIYPPWNKKSFVQRVVSEVQELDKVHAERVAKYLQNKMISETSAKQLTFELLGQFV